jgi:hypothetical protein
MWGNGRMIDDFERMADEIDEELDEVIVDDVQAESTINHIREIEAEYQRLIDICKGQIDRYQTKINAYQEQTKERTAFYYLRLKDFFASRDDKRVLKTKMTYRLPSGTITLKFGVQKIDYNEKALLAWLKDNGYDEFITQRTVDAVRWSELKEKIAVAGEYALMAKDGEDQNGEIIEGITVYEKPDEIEFKLTE